MFCAGLVEEQIKPASEGTVSVARCCGHAPTSLWLILLLLFNIHKEISGTSEEVNEVTLPCLSPGSRSKLAEAGSDFAAAGLLRERRARGLALDGIFFKKELL